MTPSHLERRCVVHPCPRCRGESFPFAWGGNPDTGYLCVSYKCKCCGEQWRDERHGE